MAAAPQSPPGSLVYHVGSRTWEVRGFSRGRRPGVAPPAISRQTLQAVSIRGGRSSHEEKDAWSNSTHLLLRAEPWSIARSTEFVVIEQILVVLLKFIEYYWTLDGAPDFLDGWSWCMGASLKATFDGQNELGNSTELHLALCPRTEWTGNGRGKVGNACKRCCDGVPTNTVSIGGTFCHPGAVVKKCVWLKCCYGRRPFGGTSALPWSVRCEQQKKLQGGGAVKTSVRPAAQSDAKGAPGKPAKKRKVIAPVPTWPTDAAGDSDLSPSVSPLITPRGRSGWSPDDSLPSGSGGVSPLPSPIPAITPRGRAAAQIVANMRNTRSMMPASTSFAT